MRIFDSESLLATVLRPSRQPLGRRPVEQAPSHPGEAPETSLRDTFLLAPSPRLGFKVRHLKSHGDIKCLEAGARGTPGTLTPSPHTKPGPAASVEVGPATPLLPSRPAARSDSEEAQKHSLRRLLQVSAGLARHSQRSNQCSAQQHVHSPDEGKWRSLFQAVTRGERN